MRDPVVRRPAASCRTRCRSRGGRCRACAAAAGHRTRNTATVHSRIGYSSARTSAKSGRTNGSWRSIHEKRRSELVHTRAVRGCRARRWRYALSAVYQCRPDSLTKIGCVSQPSSRQQAEAEQAVLAAARQHRVAVGVDAPARVGAAALGARQRARALARERELGQQVVVPALGGQTRGRATQERVRLEQLLDVDLARGVLAPSRAGSADRCSSYRPVEERSRGRTGRSSARPGPRSSTPGCSDAWSSSWNTGSSKR